MLFFVVLFPVWLDLPWSMKLKGMILPELVKKWVWSGKTTITQCSPTHGTVRKNHRTFIVTINLSGNNSKTTIFLFLFKMIANLEWTQSNVGFWRSLRRVLLRDLFAGHTTVKSHTVKIGRSSDSGRIFFWTISEGALLMMFMEPFEVFFVCFIFVM